MSGAFQIQLFARVDGTFGWRLLGGNNREIGRCTRRHPDAVTCRDEIELVRRQEGRLDARVRRATPNRWVWEVTLDGVPVAAAAHSFDRMIRCEQSLAVFLARLNGARVGETVTARRGLFPATVLGAELAGLGPAPAAALRGGPA